MDDFSDHALKGSRAERIVITVVSVLIGLSVIGLGIYGVLALSDAIRDTTASTEDLVQTSTSPDGRWLVEVYEVNWGAGSSIIYHVKAKPASGGSTRVILYLNPRVDQLQWAHDGSDFAIEWQSSDTVLVGGHIAHLPVEQE